MVDAASGAALAKATLLIASVREGMKPVGTRTTGADGHFEFDHLVAGKYLLMAQRRGYRTEKLDEHGAFSTAVVVGPGLVSEGIVFRLHPDGSLSGRVSDEANEPVAHAQVMLFAARSDDPKAMQQLRNTQTNDEGMFYFLHMEPAIYVIAVTARPWYARPHRANGTPDAADAATSSLDVAYPLTFYPGTTDEQSATPITLATGERFTADITMRAVPALHLEVHSPGGTDAAPQLGTGFSVQKKVFDSEIYIPATVGGKVGAYEIAGVAPGHYEMIATVNEGGSQTESRQEIDLVTNGEIESTNPAASMVSVSGAFRIEGQASAEATSRVAVVLDDAKNYRQSTAWLKPDGTFDFGQTVVPGKYHVSLNANLIYVKSISASGARVSGNNVTIGSEAVKLTLTAGRGLGTVDGVAFHDEQPQSGAMIVLVPENTAEEQSFRRDQSDSDGSFTLASVFPGKYVVIAVARWDILWQDPATLSHYLSRGQKIEVQPGGKYQVKVEVQ